MAKIYLVRHAESIANVQGIYQGQTYDTDLSKRGVMQAQALAQHFQYIPISRVIASPLKRTLQTATIVAFNKHLPVQLESQIIETNHGEWEGKHKDVIKKRGHGYIKNGRSFRHLLNFLKANIFWRPRSAF